MQIKKIFAAIAASAMAISAMAVSTFAAISGGTVVNSTGDWHWDAYDLTEEDLIDDIDPANVSKIVVKVKEASHTWPVVIRFHSTLLDPDEGYAEITVMPGETAQIDSLLFGERFFFNLCICTDQPVSNNVNWDVYTEGESAAEGDDTAADDTTGDDTAADDTAADDTAADDTAADDTAGDDTAGDDTAADGETGADAGEGADGDKANSDTGVEGLAVVAGLAIVATGAVVVAKKRG